jgi:hypothetical protein
MTIESIDIELDLTNSLKTLNQAIETALLPWGEPLRWAITIVDPVTNMARIEAIVIRD